jgi:predicted ChrR family anti-sigma factor
MTARRAHEKAVEDAALYVLGCLPEAEAAAFERHLAECSDCRAEVRQLEETAAALAPVADPPPELKARVLEAVATVERGRTVVEAPAAARPTQSWKTWARTQGNGRIFVPAGDTGWEPLGVEGVTAKPLFVDPDHNRVTMLVRMAPGSTYPAHRHGGAEESFILEGDLDDGDVHMNAGDYLWKDDGTLHGVQVTKSGCLMLIISSLHDELVEAGPG